MLEDLSPHENLLAAIIIQAAGDFVDAYQAGLIDDDCNVNIEAVKRMIFNHRKRRCRFPKWMDSTDIKSVVVFLFERDYLECVIPQRWKIEADAIRRSVIKAARDGRRISSFFVYSTK